MERIISILTGVVLLFGLIYLIPRLFILLGVNHLPNYVSGIIEASVLVLIGWLLSRKMNHVSHILYVLAAFALFVSLCSF